MNKNINCRAFKCVLIMLSIFNFIITSKAGALSILKPLKPVHMNIQINDSHLRDVQVAKEDQFIYIYGDIEKPLDQDFSRTLVIISLLDTQGNVIAKESSRVSFINHSRMMNQKGYFSIKIKLDLKVASAKADVLW